MTEKRWLYFALGVTTVISILLGGCGPPRIDISSEEELEASLERVRESLPEDQREAFDSALQEMAFDGLAFEDLLSEGAVPGVSALAGRMKDRLEGKTAEEVLAEGQRIRHERELKAKEQAMQEITELRTKQAEAEQARKELQRFEVLRSRFYKRPQSYGRPEPVIELTVRNGTEFAV